MAARDKVFTLRDRCCRLRSGRKSGELFFIRARKKKPQITGEHQTPCAKCLHWQTKIDPGGGSWVVFAARYGVTARGLQSAFCLPADFPLRARATAFIHFTRPPAVSSPEPGTVRKAHSRTLYARLSIHPLPWVCWWLPLFALCYRSKWTV